MIRTIDQNDPEYPVELLDLEHPPERLWLKGPLNLNEATLRAVGVVGSRACTAYGERAVDQIVDGLAPSWTIVSGLAFGIDAAAHRAAIGRDAPTIAVIACGIDMVYPRAHQSLADHIVEEGLIVSEYEPGTDPSRGRFLGRNRIIAALSKGLVVVEASQRSGAMNTVGHAQYLGRPVMAVPGPITSMASDGPNMLLHLQTARAVTDGHQVAHIINAHRDATWKANA